MPEAFPSQKRFQSRRLFCGNGSQKAFAPVKAPNPDVLKDTAFRNAALLS